MNWTYKFSILNYSNIYNGSSGDIFRNTERAMHVEEKAITRMILIEVIENWLKGDFDAETIVR